MTKQRTIWPARWIHGCPGFLQVTLDNFAVSIMIRRVTDQEKFEGWLSGQTCDLRGETGFCSCLLTLAEGEDRLSKLPFHKHTHTHTHTHTQTLMHIPSTVFPFHFPQSMKLKLFITWLIITLYVFITISFLVFMIQCHSFN